jgi:hypothetical protein
MDPSLAKPEATVVIREHSTGAELVEITMLAPDYPLEALSQIAEQVGALAGSPSRGVYVHVVELVPGQKFAKASFATNHLIERDSGALWLEPIVRAFAGAPEPHRLRCLAVTFVGQAATASTLKSYRTPHVALEAKFLPGTPSGNIPPAIEYRVAINTHNPAEISIPKTYEPASTTKASTLKGGAISPTAIALIGISMVAVGALVYWLVLRLSEPGRG